ncbi:MAG: RsmB/NOP family class I SAM-dependent RNA methyltransferase [Kofleriaceae bacterium]
MIDGDKAQTTNGTDSNLSRQLARHVLQGGRLNGTILELWQRTRMDWGFVTDRLSSVFRRERWIGAQERRFISETLYGLVRHLRRVDLAISLASRRAASPRDVDRLLALLVLEGAIEPADAARASASLDWARCRQVDDVIRGERDPKKRLALAASLPDWLARRLHADWGDEALPLALALNERAPMTVRANTLVNPRDELAEELAEAGLRTRAGRWSDTALLVDTRTNLFGTEAFARGAYEAQDEGSQLLAELAVPATPRPLVVDLCAGAGGKTLAIAARLGNRGRIVATDVEGKKLEELRRRARRGKVSIAQAVTIDDGAWPPQLANLRGKADAVLVDAPCSGIGALRRNPEARWRLTEDDVAKLTAIQRSLIERAAGLCAPGGRVVYATCTVLRAENQDLIDAVTTARPELRRVSLRDVLGARAEELGGDALVVTPHRHGTDGFFAQVLAPGEP